MLDFKREEKISEYAVYYQTIMRFDFLFTKAPHNYNFMASCEFA